MASRMKQLRKVHVNGEVWKYLPGLGAPQIWGPDKKERKVDMSDTIWDNGDREYPKNSVLPSDVKSYIEKYLT